MTARDRLDAVKARLEAATPGPWETYRTRGGGDHDNFVVRPDDLGGIAMQYALVWAPGDAELIAHAPADLAALHALVEAVLALAERLPREMRVNTSDGTAYANGRASVAADLIAAVETALHPKEEA